MGIPINIATIATSRPALLQLHGSKEKGDIELQKAFSAGTLVEFTEKKRSHIGQIIDVEHKSNGGARYEIKDHEGHKHQIADKAINYAMALTPNDAKNLKHIFDTFQAAFEQPDTSLQNDLDISPELLEMAWEEALEEETHELTPNSLIENSFSCRFKDRSVQSLETYEKRHCPCF